MTEIRRIHQLEGTGIEKLAAESETEGYRFVRRLIDDFESGRNRFGEKGEILLGVWEANGRLVAVGGLNRDPFTEDENIGRLRRFYVSADSRRHGIGSLLLDAIVSRSTDFQKLVLRTDSANADAFYRKNGFLPVEGHPEYTHERKVIRS
ncbi:GNAT family N-acetyltransferase [Indiicoccus explosivorum]|uniref:GNAT family N-acetyltransferase n=1 Tax=Indiicoccus explosivorum TaxID=1917864 RepID=UPI000B43C37C|nr:GNAT family N-acetyltransferase [Indiicoccus explosivorum]